MHATPICECALPKTQRLILLTGAGDGKVKFWDLRKTDKPSWQLNAPSPGVGPPGAAQALTPTPPSKTKVVLP